MPTHARVLTVARSDQCLSVQRKGSDQPIGALASDVSSVVRGVRGMQRMLLAPVAQNARVADEGVALA